MALSPTLSSEDVASDWKEALEDLREPSEHAIFNLVTIARENLDHAQAISRVTIQHIKTVKSPQAKLNAFYVLDAIVKRIRSPYTMYFGHQLFNLYMGAYTTMDGHHRHMMDKLFETWIVPVPGSHTPEPVFEPQYTKPIQDALAKWRSAIQQPQRSTPPPHRLPARPPPPGGYPPYQHAGYQNTPPPKNHRFPLPDNGRIPSPGPGVPPPTQYPNYPPPNNQPTPSTTYPSFSPQAAPHPAYPYPQPPTAQVSTPTPFQGNYGATPTQFPSAPTLVPAITQDQLKATLQTVMQNAAEDYKKTPVAETASLLRTLDGLRQVLDQQRLPHDQVESINREVSRIGAAFMPKPQQNTLSASQLIAALLGGASQPALGAQPPAIVPPIAVSTPRIPTPTQAPAPVSAPPPDVSSLFDQLQAAGLLSSVTPTPAPIASIATSLRGPSFSDPASLKVKGLDPVKLLYDAKPDQCRQCGRRFPATSAGREHKAKHLDWHFHTNSRVAESSQSVITRSWYIDEREWIAYREDKDGLPIFTDAKGGASGISARQDPKSKWVPIPTDPAQANSHCAICMEKFEKVWSKEVDQPVWIDAVNVGGKYLHASCFEEISKQAQRTTATPAMASVAMARTSSAQSARSTPDLVLGKRKAEEFATGNDRRKSPRI